MRRLAALAALAALFGCATEPRPTNQLPERVSVRPVFFVPAGEAQPSDAQRAKAVQHLVWARQRYVALLGSAGGFGLDTVTTVVQGGQNAAFYAAQFESGVPLMTVELLEHWGLTRYSAGWVYVIIVMNADADQPTGGGRPINGGFNNGGGIVVLSSYALDSIAFFQSTLRHELGHAFGLVHVELYGRSMDTDSSLMSYNPAHHSDGFTDSPTPGTLGFEERAALALNQRVFPGLTYTGPVIPTLYGLVPMTLPGHPDFEP